VRSQPRPRQILVVQEEVPAYRVPFFDQLDASLRGHGVELTVTAQAADDVRSDWFAPTPLQTWRRGGRAITRHRLPGSLAEYDLVVIEQANRHAALYRLLAQRALHGTRMALWGHGANLQAGSGPVPTILEGFKRTYSRLPDWWFAYTAGSAARVAALGFPRDRITVVANSIDTSAHEHARARGISREPDLTAFVGTLHRHKRLDFLIKAADEVHMRRPGFRLLIAGDGPDAERLRAVYWPRHHVQFLGRTTAVDTADLLARSQLLLMPGLVGLVAVDSMAAGCPIVTTHDGLHSPEIEYLRDGRNAVIMPAGTSERQYARRVADLLASPRQLAELSARCIQDSAEHELSDMVAAFAEGVLGCISASRRWTPSSRPPMTAHA
jgi:glycosyltransferase involved in cell wall biosynthesis